MRLLLTPSRDENSDVRKRAAYAHWMSLGSGSRDQSRRTLRFANPELEREYQASAAVNAAQLRSGPLVAIGLWAAGGLLAPAVTHAPPLPIYAIAAAMAIANVSGAALAPRATTLDRQQFLGMTLNVLAGIAVLAIAALTDTFDQYAAPGLMLIAVFAFIVLRLQFTLAAVVTATYIGLFAVFGLTLGSPSLGLNLFLVTAAVIVACGGTYVLEDAQRRVFVQGRQIAALHAQVDRLFHQYLSPDVAAALLAEPSRSELGGELVDVSVLFIDLKGFTAYSEHILPAAVVGLLNDYFEAIVPIVFAEGGTIVQFAGDALMAIFNAPVRQANHAVHAARAALALQAAVAAIAADDPTRPRFRAGVNTGPAVVGNVGGQEMRNFTAIGDTTNLAARLQTFAEPGQVVVGEATYARIAEIARVRVLGTPTLKGKSDPIVAYELLGLDRQPSIGGRSLATRSLG